MRHDEAIKWDTGRAIYIDFLTSQPVTPTQFEETTIILGGHAGNTDPEIYSAFRDYNADVEPDERYRTYPEYVEDSRNNYEMLILTDGTSKPEDKEDIQFWLDKLRAEFTRLFTDCGACGSIHAKPEDCDLHPSKEEKGVTVNVRLWIGDWIDAPVTTVRDLLSAYDGTEWLTIEEIWVDDPE